MKRAFQLGLMVVTMLAGQAGAGEILDRVVAVVNNTPIFQSDWELALRTEALLDARTPESLSASEQREVFGRLVDQELLREQMRGFTITPVTNENVNERIEEIRTQLQADSSEGKWQQLLASASLSEEELRARVRIQLEVLRFLDMRFRPTIRVDFRTVQQYYRDQFLPELRRRGAKEVPLSEVAGKIREILTQQRMSEQVTSWLQTLREQAEIRVPGEKQEQAISQNE